MPGRSVSLAAHRTAKAGEFLPLAQDFDSRIPLSHQHSQRNRRYSTTKMRIKDLESNDIFISEEPADEGALQSHIEKVRDSLLDFTWTVVDGADGGAETLHHVDDDTFLERLKDHHRALPQAFIERIETLREDARMHSKGGDREAEWQRFFSVNFFDPLVEAVKPRLDDTRQ